MSDFDRSVKFVLDHEVVFQKGHYGDWAFVKTENVAGDRGGMTRYGIDKRSHPGVNIDKLSKEQAIEIYRKEYWNAGRCDQMPWPVNLAHFDGCVNVGAGQAAKFLQRAVGAHDDGAIGPKTLQKLKEACDATSPKEIAEKIAELRVNFYKHLAVQNPEDAEFLNGWLNRVSDLKKNITV